MSLIYRGMSDKWHGLMRILEITWIRGGKIIYYDTDLANTLHFLGEAFCLSALFTGGTSPNTVIPASYYMGLDARPTINVNDTMQSLLNEPVGNGYARQLLSSTTGFTIDVGGGYHRAVGNVITFSASGVGWGPVNNIFLTDKGDNTGTLIASAPLSTPIQANAGDQINMRMAMSLRDCP